MYQALGFKTLKAQKQIFLNLGNKGNIGNAITTYENMDAENSALKVNAISTIVALLMPALNASMHDFQTSRSPICPWNKLLQNDGICCRWYNKM